MPFRWAREVWKRGAGVREMNLSDMIRSESRLRQVNIVKTRVSRKTRSEDEIVILMKTVRNRFAKAVASGRIQKVGEREWILR